MSFYDTGLPVPSNDPRDLDDNAKHIDELVNSTFPTFVDRLGTTRRTLAGIEADNTFITSPTGSSLVGVQQSGAGAEVRSAQDKFREGVTPQDYGAVGDSVTNDTARFAALEVVHTNKEIDLLGLTYRVDSFPIGNRYYNGFFIRSGDGATVQSAHAGVVRSGNSNVLIGRNVAPGLTDYSYLDPLGSGRGYNLTALGDGAMGSAGNDLYNCTATGKGSMFSNQFGRYCDSYGLESMYYTTGILGDPTAGTRIAAFGSNTLRFNTIGHNLGAFGRNAGQINTTATHSVFLGPASGAGSAPLNIAGVIINPYPRTASYQSATGVESLSWSNGQYNTVNGYGSGKNIKLGDGNVAIGGLTLSSLEVDVSPLGTQIVIASLAGTWSQSGTTLTFNMTAHGMSAGFTCVTTMDTGAPLTAGDSQYFVVTGTTTDTWTATAPDSATRSGTCTRTSYYNLTPVAASVANTAGGHLSMDGVKKGSNNAAYGAYTLRVTTGDNNAMFGVLAGTAIVAGTGNLGGGYSALRNLITGISNAAGGEFSLSNLTAGNENSGWGRSSLRLMQDGSTATALTNCGGFGYDSRVSGNNQIQLGNSATTTYVYGTVQNRSDVRDKAEIRATALGLDFILGLEPIDYKWDMRDDYIEWVKDPVTGEEVAKVFPRDGSKMRNRYHHGFRAQDIQNRIMTTGVDFGGFQHHEVSGGCDVMSLGYDEFIAPIVRGVQQQHTDFILPMGRALADLTARILALENAITA